MNNLIDLKLGIGNVNFTILVGLVISENLLLHLVHSTHTPTRTHMYIYDIYIYVTFIKITILIFLIN